MGSLAHTCTFVPSGKEKELLRSSLHLVDRHRWSTQYWEAREIYPQTSILESKEIEPYKVSSEIISNSLKQQVKLQSSLENI